MPHDIPPKVPAPLSSHLRDETPERPGLLAEAVDFSVGRFLKVSDTVCRIVSVEDESAILEHYSTSERRRVPIATLLTMRPGIDLTFLPTPSTTDDMVALIADDERVRSRVLKLPMDGASFAQRRDTVIKMTWVQVLADHGFAGCNASELWLPDLRAWAAKYKLPLFSGETLARWSAQLEDRSGFLPRYDLRGGRGRLRIDSRSAELIGQIIYEARGPASSIRLRPTEILDAFHTRAAKWAAQADPSGKELPKPSLSTVSRILKDSVSLYEIAVDRFGKRRADRVFTPSERRPAITYAGGVTEFDDLDTKVFCISRKTGLGWGRPQLTYGIDQATCYPVGLKFDNQPRSAVSAIGALVHSIECKDMTAYGPKLSHLQWPAFGYPTGILFDNALYNNERIVTLNADVADPSWARPFQPREKRVVEYVNGQTVTDFLSREPGWRGAKDDPEALKEGLKTAVRYFEDLRDRHLLWLLGVYANRPMRDGETPQQKYLEEGRVKLRARFPPDTRRLRLLRMIPFAYPLTWNGNGIRTMGLDFQDSDAYRKWISRAGGAKKVHASIDPDYLSELYISVPDSDYILMVPCLNKEYVEGLTLYQHKMVLKMATEMKRKNPSIVQMLEAREALRLDTERLARSGKVKERKFAERVGSLPASKESAKGVVAEHDLEAEYRKLDAVVLSTDCVGWEMPSVAG